VITCPANIVLAVAAGQCAATVNYTVTASDNCTSTTTLTNGYPSGAVIPVGSSAINWLATDVAGNTSACSCTVTIADNTNPSIVCPSNLTGTTNTGLCTAEVTYPNPTFSDNCSQAVLSRTSGLASGAAFPKGITMVNWMVTDVGGNTAVCEFTVTVTDGQAPTITCPANTSKNTDVGLCTTVVTYTTPVVSDNCSGASATLLSGQASGTVFSKGANTVVWKATDGAGLTATCAFTVTVNDNQAPTITCPANQVKTADAGLCTAVTTYSAPTAADNCSAPSVAIQSGLASGGAFPRGVSTVVWRATDAVGLTKTCTFRVTVNDLQAPVITCPPNQVKSMDAGLCTAITTYLLATFTDNCTGGSVAKLSGLASGAAFPKGVSNVTFKATDGVGNQSSCTMTVTVTDAQLPVITCPGNIVVVGSITNGLCTAVVNYAPVTASDNCSIVSNFLSSGQASGSTFSEGVTTNIWQATDNNGLTATCAFTVTVGCGMNSSSKLEVRSSKLVTIGHGNSVNMRLAPNPATTEVQVILEGLPENGGQLTVFDAQGRVVRPQSSVQSPMTSIHISDLPSGLYQVRLQTEHGVVTKGLVVTRL
jgi:hypothetical protein